MIVVKVTYTVKEAYITSNKEKIQAFLSDFQQFDTSQFSYTIFEMEDKRTFVHLSQYENKAIQQALLAVPSFIAFQQSRDENLLSEPKIEFLELVGSTVKNKT